MIRVTHVSSDLIERGPLPMDGIESVPRGPASSVVAPEALDPAQLRLSILAEHRKIRELLAKLEASANTLLACGVSNPRERRATRRLALHLCDVMSAHVAVENELLVPVVEQIDAWGAVRAQRLLEEHAEQLRLLQAYIAMLADGTDSGQALALTAWRLVQSIREDIQAEESGVLRQDLFCAWGVEADVETG